MKSLLEQLLLAAVRKLTPAAAAIAVERTSDAAHGDFTSNVAMRLAKALGRDPRELAQAIVAALPASPLIGKAEVGGNGFINFFLEPTGLAREIRGVHELGDAYGRSSSGAGQRLTVGVLSNPRDLVEGRYAAYSESLANVLAAAGYEVEREVLLEAPSRGPQSPGGSESRAESSGVSDPATGAVTDAVSGAVSDPIDLERSSPHGPLSRPAIEGFFLRPVTIRQANNRASITSLQQLRERIGTDACRFFFLTRPHHQSLDIDLTLATTRTIENPLYSVQYAHARAASATKEARARAIPFDATTGLSALELLDQETERALIAALLRFPDEVESAAANCAPHSIVYYLRAVANAFHNYYNAEKWFVAEDDLRNARLALVLAAGQVVRNGLALIGVSAPESM